MKIIAIDSSGLVASVAIVEDDILIGEYNVQYKKTHSQTLLPMLDELSRMVELDLSTVDAIAISKGPGSFTGLRIGSATAKGLGLAMNVPLVEIPTLDGLACNLYGTDKLVCPIMDARRNQVYTGIYEYAKIDRTPFAFELQTVLSQCAVAVSELADRLNDLGREVIFLGDGVPVYAGNLAELMKVPYSFAPAHMNRQRAAAFGMLAFRYMREGKVTDAGSHAPEYLRLSQAEREKMSLMNHSSEENGG
ncbi:MAG: tRNA (adenosine(37)-N6)-threonylcarbamoyltransferase complex dimerization subunit type 1 TsaB [Bacillota bacterium]|nr:tRNA (adenosine(37)-N6)-threonylcarbamoyltransferase complex dimerization subunit type 1 TsaB [Bacillota bacterium]